MALVMAGIAASGVGVARLTAGAMALVLGSINVAALTAFARRGVHRGLLPDRDGTVVINSPATLAW